MAKPVLKTITVAPPKVAEVTLHFVMDSSGKPVAGVTAQLFFPSNTYRYLGVSDKNGRISFKEPLEFATVLVAFPNHAAKGFPGCQRQAAPSCIREFSRRARARLKCDSNLSKPISP